MNTRLSDITQDPRWARLEARDKTADGSFWYSVATTGVYCRPSCPSRLANPKNVRLHDSVAAAEAAGFRACRRCNPGGISTDTANAEIVTKACRLIDEAIEPLSLSQLAESVELSPHYFHRLFKQATGLTPKAYAAARRSARLREGLATAATVTEAFHDAGFGSNGRFYEASAGVLGMSPTHYRSGGAHEVLSFAVGQCSLGAILVASSAKGVAAILLGDDPDALVRELEDRFPKARLVGADAAYERLVAQVVGLVEAPGRGLALPLDVRGTAFQQRVWMALREIPPGETRTYSAIAEQIGSPRSVRAVAGACAANALAVAIPCHRVVRHDGGLSGYRWGVERKRELIARESAEHARPAPEHAA
ncbi:MAG TPA: bifunctional DNA-binding transcriptional regulator/O6-methylguanine-DNA methyltransferase Ada [Burkholderiaceae bacterium]|jgi:AraC family transcriptional regulator of adaptative response/methylated-DNA-[protein]-cysteine methyltransferase